MITTFIAVGSLIIGVLIGHFQGYLMGVKERNLKRVVMRGPSGLMCLCSHGKQTHRMRGRGGCDVSTRPGYYCACRYFVSDPKRVPKVKLTKTELNILDLSA